MTVKVHQSLPLASPMQMTSLLQLDLLLRETIGHIVLDARCDSVLEQ